MKKHLVIVSTLIWFLWGCGGNVQDNNQFETVKIGVVLPMTGPASIYGEYAKAGQEKALEQLKKDYPKLDLELVFEDGQASPKQSILAYQNLRGQGIDLFITTISSVCLSILPQAKEDSVLLFADAAHPGITEPKSALVFRHSNTAAQEASLMLEHLSKEGNLKIAIIYLNDDYGLAVVENLKAQMSNYEGLELVFEEGYGKDESDFNILSRKVQQSEPDITVLVSFGPTMGMLVKKIREADSDAPILASIGLIITGADKTAGNAVHGIEYVNFDFDAAGDTSEVNPFEALEFGTIMLLGKAINEVGSGPVKIAEYITNLRTFESGVENMEIRSTNDIQPSLKIERYE